MRTAAERAGAAGAKDVKTVAVQGSPVETLLDVVRREKADLLVVGNRGLAGIKGRLLGSVPADATRRSYRFDLCRACRDRDFGSRRSRRAGSPKCPRLPDVAWSGRTG